VAKENSTGSETPDIGPSDPLKESHDARVKDFHDTTGVEPSGGLPIIQWSNGELPRMVDEAEASLLNDKHVRLFQRGSMVVRVVRLPAMNSRYLKRLDAGALGIVGVDRHFLVEQMTRCARWEKFDSRTDKWKRINAPEDVAVKYLARSGQWKLPPLLSVIAAPTLRPDGSVLQEPGYDEATATWYEPPGITFPHVPAKPSDKQVEAALAVLIDALKTLPFVDAVDKSVMLAMMLTALVRRSLPSAPLGAITAPAPGTGKSLIGECIGIMATGVLPAAMTFPSSDEEAEKLALTLLQGGESIFFIDNIKRPLEGDWLCTILTSEIYQGRWLGRNEKLTVPTNTTFLATGNKLTIKGDLRRRALLCRLDAKHENPHQRKFDRNLKDIFRERRAQLVSAGLTLIRGYLTAGERASVFRPWGSFEDWSKFCREPLMWRGFADPCESYETIEADDPERNEHKQMVAGWHAVFGDKPATANQYIEQLVLEAFKEFRSVLQDIALDRVGALSAKKLGNWLRSHADRPILGQVFEKAGEERGSTLWKLVAVKG
jgi:putative DNA primase/helicase